MAQGDTFHRDYTTSSDLDITFNNHVKVVSVNLDGDEAYLFRVDGDGDITGFYDPGNTVDGAYVSVLTSAGNPSTDNDILIPPNGKLRVKVASGTIDVMITGIILK